MMEPVVYFFRRSDEAIKIGYTKTNVLSRLKSQQRKFGKIDLLGVMDGNTTLESLLHKRFSSARILDSEFNGREWFSPIPELLGFIEVNARPYELEKQERDRVSLSAQLTRGVDDDLIEWIEKYGTGYRQAAFLAAVRLGLGLDPRPEPIPLKLQRQLAEIDAQHKAILKQTRDAILSTERRFQQAMKTKGLLITEVSPFVLQIRAENIRNANW